jgi:hypothetical protein
MYGNLGHYNRTILQLVAYFYTAFQTLYKALLNDAERRGRRCRTRNAINRYSFDRNQLDLFCPRLSPPTIAFSRRLQPGVSMIGYRAALCSRAGSWVPVKDCPETDLVWTSSRGCLNLYCV